MLKILVFEVWLNESAKKWKGSSKNKFRSYYRSCAAEIKKLIPSAICYMNEVPKAWASSSLYKNITYDDESSNEQTLKLKARESRFDVTSVINGREFIFF